jgi:hypothetical protein
VAWWQAEWEAKRKKSHDWLHPIGRRVFNKEILAARAGAFSPRGACDHWGCRRREKRKKEEEKENGAYEKKEC